MPSIKNRKLGYLKEHSINAYWMLRQGRFSVFLETLKNEADVQFEAFRDRVIRYAEADVQYRFGFDVQVDARGTTVNLSRLDSEYIDKRKLRPKSYRPTLSKRVDAVSMQANPEAVTAELRGILSSLHVKERG